MNILDAARNYLDPSKVSKISFLTGLNENEIAVSMPIVFPTVLAGFIGKANDGNENANDLLEIVNNIHDNEIQRNDNFLRRGIIELEKGQTLLKALLGEKLNSFINIVASYAKIPITAAGLLFGAGSIMIADLLGKSASENNFNSIEFSSYLEKHKAVVMNSIPCDLSQVSRLLGLQRKDRNLDIVPKCDKVNPAINRNTINKGTIVFMFFVMVVLISFLIWW